MQTEFGRGDITDAGSTARSVAIANRPESTRVVQVCLGFQTGGTPLAVAQFSRVFGGWVIYFGDQQASRIVDSALHIPVGSGPAAAKFSWVNSRSLAGARTLLESADLIICHALFRYHIQWAADIARRNGIPLWVVPHGSLDPWVFSYRSFQKKLWMRLFGNAILSSATAVLCATRREAAKAALLGLPMNSRIVMWAAEAPVGTTPASRREEIRQKLGILPSDRVLLFLGRLHEMKRPLETIRALKLSGAENVHLMVIGGDETISAGDCRSLSSELGIAARVHVLGPLFGAEKWDHIAAADGYISLSRRENFGYTVAESLMAARPLILSPGNDLGGELENVGCGWLLKTDEEQEAADAIREFALLGIAELRASGEKGQAWARSHLSPENLNASLTGLLAETTSLRND